MARRAAQGQPDTKDTPDEVSSPVPLCLFVCICMCLAKAEQGPAKYPSSTHYDIPIWGSDADLCIVIFTLGRRYNTQLCFPYFQWAVVT